LFVIRKVGQLKTLFNQQKTLSNQRKYFSVKRKIWFGFQKNVFSFGCVYFSKSDFLNLKMSIFADYIKFDPQTFDCYI